MRAGRRAGLAALLCHHHYSRIDQLIVSKFSFWGLQGIFRGWPQPCGVAASCSPPSARLPCSVLPSPRLSVLQEAGSALGRKTLSSPLPRLPSPRASSSLPPPSRRQTSRASASTTLPPECRNCHCAYSTTSPPSPLLGPERLTCSTQGPTTIILNLGVCQAKKASHSSERTFFCNSAPEISPYPREV